MTDDAGPASSTQDRFRSLRERFPAVMRLEHSARRRRVPYIQQNHPTDCGPACLAMVLRFLGREVGVSEVRDHLGAGRDGVSALALMDAARLYGLRGRAVRLDLQDLDYLERGAILHWRMNHFVVLDRITRNGVEIVDPALGRRLVTMQELGKSFTGVALSFEPTHTFEPGTKARSRVWQYLRRFLRHSDLMTKILVTSVFTQVFALALPIFTGAIVDRVVPRGDVDLLLVITAGIAMIVVFSFLTSFLRAHLLLHLRTNLDVQMALDFLDHLMKLPFSFFQLRQTGDLMMRLNSNTTIRETLTSTALSAVLDGVLVTSYLAVLLFTHPGLGLLVLGLGLLRVGIYLVTRRKVRDLMSRSLQAQAESSNYQVQMLEGIETLKSAGAERRAIEHWSNLLVDVTNVSIARGRLNAVVQSTLGALATASPLILLGYGGYLVLQGDLSLGTMLAMNALAAGFLGPLSSLVSTALQFQTLSSYLDRVEDILEKQPEQDASRVRPAPKLSGKIALEGVSFRYAELSPWALQDVCVEFEPGMTVAIVGRSGSGKSTLARLLVGLYRAPTGEILFDDQSLDGFDVGSIRRQIGFVPQVPFLFATSIRNNIAITDPDVPLPSIQHAAEMAHIHHEIMEMPLGYDTPITAGGASLAGGQRQRIALARALMGHPSILVLDEATSHLDALAEARVHENLEKLPATRILIAHRLSTVVDADLILVMDQGRIVERGRHDELLGLGGLYAKLIRSQMKGTRHPSIDP
ncbi:MAG: peptidase domain-containing ABC transporter [Candidatus Krumholzibacteriia bacterium]